MIKKITVFFLGLMLLIPIHGLAASDSKITVDMHYLVISPTEDGSTNLSNMVNFTNTSAEEFTGDGTSEAVLNVTLPEGAKDISFLDNKIAFKQVDKGFITTTPIPGNQTVVLPFSYRMEKGKEINITTEYPVQMMQILVPEDRGSIEVNGVEATSQGIFKFDDQNYYGYSIEGIKADQSFVFVYNKDIQPPTDETKSTEKTSESGKESSITRTAPAFHNPGHLRIWAQSPLHRFNPHIFLIILSAIIIAGISYYVYFRRKARLGDELLESDKEEKAFKLLMAKQKAIMDKIIELEETFDDGLLSEADYHAKLAAYKQHLVQVKLNLRNFVE
ncbi:MAG: hypothetical protein K6T88_06975 [Bacillus sp. (in: Bacteria)]|nr:hypothetical protein [Bacillus sp. (in: firmicutes)]